MNGTRASSQILNSGVQNLKGMKKIRLLPLLLAVVLSACGRQACKVSGFYVGGNATAVVYLLGLEGENVADTLGRAAVLNGRFLLEGEVTGTRECRLRVEDEFRGTVLGEADFRLRGGDWFACLGATDGSWVVEDGEESALGEAFWRNDAAFEAGRKELMERFAVATEEGKDSLAARFEELVAARESEETRLVRERPDSRAAACAVATEVSAYAQGLYRYRYAFGGKVNGASQEVAGWAALEERIGLLGPEGRKSLEADGRLDRMRGRMEQVRRTMATSVGGVAPDMVLTFADGDEVSLHAIGGKLKIVDFWASWCGPCRKSHPFLLELYGEYKARGLEMVSVSVDEKKEAWQKAVAEDGLSWRYNVRDLKGQAGGLYGISSIPCVLLLDGENRILGRDLPKAELRRMVEERLGTHK